MSLRIYASTADVRGELSGAAVVLSAAGLLVAWNETGAQMRFIAPLCAVASVALIVAGDAQVELFADILAPHALQHGFLFVIARHSGAGF